MDNIILITILLALSAGLFYVLHFVYRLFKGEKSEGTLSNAPSFSKALPVLGVVLVFAVTFWYLRIYEPAASYSVTSIDLFNEFRENKIAAYDKYANQYIEVTGKHVGSDVVFQSPVILLQAASLSNSVQCNFPLDRAGQAGALKAGEQVTLKGKVIGQNGNVVLDQCSVIR